MNDECKKLYTLISEFNPKTDEGIRAKMLLMKVLYEFVNQKNSFGYKLEPREPYYGYGTPDFSKRQED